MTQRPRIIASLTIKNHELVKTKNFKTWKYLGDPINAVKIFNDKNADELMITDISNSKPDLNFIEKVSSECFMPVCYSGGIRSIQDISEIMKLGIEKVCVRSLSLNNQSELVKAINTFGSSAIVVSLDIKKSIFGYNLLHRGRSKNFTLKTLRNHIRDLISKGVGEIIFQSVNADGTLSGFDFKMIDKLITGCSVPCLISGGCKSNDDITEAFKRNYDGVVVGRFFVLKPPQDGVLIQYPREDLFERIIEQR